MKVTTSDIRLAIRNLGLAGRPLCVHSSLRSFGWVEGGAQQDNASITHCGDPECGRCDYAVMGRPLVG
jgi:aminoglycoside N3'-acetyltransferase